MRLPRWLRRFRRHTRRGPLTYEPITLPRVHHEPVPDAPDLWEHYYQMVRALAIPQEAKDAMINIAEDRRSGRDPMQRYRDGEWSVPDEPE